MKRAMAALYCTSASEANGARSSRRDRSRSSSPMVVATPVRTPVSTAYDNPCAKVSLASGRRVLRDARHAKHWPDGQKVGRGFGQPYLQYKYARAVAMKQKTVEGRPGGGWLAKGIAPNDYINFKIPGHPTLSLVVRNAINPHAFQESSELTLQPTGRLRTACLILIH